MKMVNFKRQRLVHESNRFLMTAFKLWDIVYTSVSQPL
jgi:hypothetical protein